MWAATIQAIDAMGAGFRHLPLASFEPLQVAMDIADYPDFGTFGVLMSDPPMRFVGRLEETLTYFPQDK